MQIFYYFLGSCFIVTHNLNFLVPLCNEENREIVQKSIKSVALYTVGCIVYCRLYQQFSNFSLGLLKF
jgi:hypothetical protein